MFTLSNLKDSSRPSKNTRRVGRGISSGAGKTCGRGQKGQGARSGYKRRYGFEGGQFPLYMKLPIRGFSNVRFSKRLDSINLGLIDKMFDDGEVVNMESLRQHGFIKGKSHGIKILGDGELTKKVKIEANAFSDTAKQKLQKANVEYAVVK
ncbi:MAG: 50S ribosomal protein L15 [Chlamydiota bacterium]|nr:50S ribosomal protein L15 [Chlamydiota bacterium]